MTSNHPSILEADVAVVGAGSTGSAVALHCARRHLDVICVDRRPIDQSGARWSNNIPAWNFDAAHLARPRQPELIGGSTPLHMLAGWGPERLILADHDMLEVDMPRLVERLQMHSKSLGSRFLGEVDVEHFDGEVLHTSQGEIRARWVVDASGLGGAGIMDLPQIDRRDICSAAQQMRRITDMDRARQFFADQDVPWGHALNFTGVAGGYSVIIVRAHGDHLSFITGSIPGLGHPSGLKLLRNFVDEHDDWIGEEISGGSAPIPLRRPVSRLTEGRAAAIGDAACQVFSAHGSGVGAGLVAARILAEALAAGEGVEGYAYRWHRQYGGLFGAYDLFRRYSTDLTPRHLERLMESGLLHPELATCGLRQKAPIPSSPAIFDPRVLLKAPDLLLSMGGVLGRMARAALLYRQYPKDPTDLPRWSERVDALFQYR